MTIRHVDFRSSAPADRYSNYHWTAPDGTIYVATANSLVFWRQPHVEVSCACKSGWLRCEVDPNYPERLPPMWHCDHPRYGCGAKFGYLRPQEQVIELKEIESL